MTRTPCRASALWAVVVAASLLAACGPDGRAGADGPRPAGEALDTVSTWTAGIVQGEGRAGVPPVGVPDAVLEDSAAGSALLEDVRLERHDGFDRLVLQFAGNRFPGYQLEYVDRPVRACGSGHPVPLPGDGWLAVRLLGARAHTEAGEATIEERERTPHDLGVIEKLALTCDFEASVVWVAAVSSPNRYRVLQGHRPARLVVDVRH